MSPGMSETIQSGMPENIQPGMSQSMPPGMSEPMPPGMSETMPPGMSGPTQSTTEGVQSKSPAATPKFNAWAIRSRQKSTPAAVDIARDPGTSRGPAISLGPATSKHNNISFAGVLTGNRSPAMSPSSPQQIVTAMSLLTERPPATNNVHIMSPAPENMNMSPAPGNVHMSPAHENVRVSPAPEGIHLSPAPEGIHLSPAPEGIQLSPAPEGNSHLSNLEKRLSATLLPISPISQSVVSNSWPVQSLDLSADEVDVSRRMSLGERLSPHQNSFGITAGSRPAISSPDISHIRGMSAIRIINDSPAHDVKTLHSDTHLRPEIVQPHPRPFVKSGMSPDDLPRSPVKPATATATSSSLVVPPKLVDSHPPGFRPPLLKLLSLSQATSSSRIGPIAYI
eukprot:991874_1